MASVVVRWVLANMLPQAFLLAATWAYLSIQGMTPEDLVVPRLVTLRQPFWYVIAAIYVVISIAARGAVLRPLVPRFSIPGWIAVALVTSAIVLVLTVSGALIGMVIAKGLAVSGRPPLSPPAGWPMPVFIVLIILVAEIMGGVLGIIPGAVIGTLEGVVVGRSSRNMGVWILGTIAAWSMIFALITLHILLLALTPRVPGNVLTAIAISMPILFGLAAALGTLSPIARVARSQPNTG